MIKFRIYFDKDEEEKWLKEMSNNGWAFRKFFLGFYYFESCEPGEYNYQIDLLDNWGGDKDEYAAFMEDIGVEVVSQWWRWIYLRKKTADGPFEMYTDAQSKIELYSRIKSFFLILLGVEIMCFFIELKAAISSGYYVYGFFTVLIGLICLVVLRVIWKCKWKIEQLKSEEI